MPSLLVGVGGRCASWDEGVSEGEDEDEMERGNGSEGGSEAYVTADEGYEADVEILDGIGTSCAANGIGAGDGAEESSSSLATTPPVLLVAQTSSRIPHNIAHPSLCLLAVELLVHLNRK